MKKFWVVFVTGVLLAGCEQEPEPTGPVIDVEAGKAIAEANCVGCHGMDGRGQTGDIPNLAAQPTEYLVDALNAYKDGRRQHAALRELAASMSDAEIVNIAAYFSSLPPVEAIDVAGSDETVGSSYREGAAVAALCADCHGENGYSTTPGIPSLASQQPAYLIVSTLEYARGNRGHQEKEAMLEGLGQMDIEKMAVYFASQVPDEREAPPFGDPLRGEPLSAPCGECHGAGGVSHDSLVPSLAGQEPVYLVNAIKAYRDKERQHEEMMAEISDDDINDIAAFYTVQKAEPAGEQLMQAKELAVTCERCHGPSMDSGKMVVPSLKGQNRDYLVRVMKAYRGDDRGSSMMHKMSSNYSDEMIEAIATYYATYPTD
jgi:cytochrome c553